MSDLITKSYSADLDVNEGKREVLAVISSDSIDRDGEVVKPSGMKRKNYSGNPVVLVGHDYTKLPVGKALWVKADENNIIAKYVVSDKTQEARDVFGLLQDGVLNAHSIGFVSIHSSKPTTAEKNLRPELKDAKLIHRDWELFEFSLVSIPANPDAIALAVSKGSISPELLKFMNGEKEGTEAKVIEIALHEVAKPTVKEMSEAIYEIAKALEVKINITEAVKKAMGQVKGDGC